MATLKEPTTFSQQVKILQDKKLQINDIKDCMDFLSKVNYYRLSGYYLPFIDKKTDIFFDNISFEQIKSIYLFDVDANFARTA